jgi:hypothetical protein
MEMFDRVLVYRDILNALMLITTAIVLKINQPIASA